MKLNSQNKDGEIVVVKGNRLPPCWLNGKKIAEHLGKNRITWVVTLKSEESLI